jgi:hypothetical protein
VDQRGLRVRRVIVGRRQGISAPPHHAAGNTQQAFAVVCADQSVPKGLVVQQLAQQGRVFREGGIALFAFAFRVVAALPSGSTMRSLSASTS